MRSVVAFAAVLLLVQLATPTSALNIFRHRRELPDRFSKIVQRVKKDLHTSVKESSSDSESEVLMPKERSFGSLFAKRVKRDLRNTENDLPANPFAGSLKRKKRSFEFPDLPDIFNILKTFEEAEEEMLEAEQEMIENADFEEVENKTFEKDIGDGQKATVHEEVLKDKKTGMSVVIEEVSSVGEECEENPDSEEDSEEDSGEDSEGSNTAQRVKRDLHTSVKKSPSDPFAKILAPNEKSFGGFVANRAKRDIHNTGKDLPADPFAEFIKRKTRSFPGFLDISNFVKTILEAGEEMLEAGEEMLEAEEKKMEVGDFEEVENKTFEEDIGNGKKATVHEEVLKDKKTGMSVVIEDIRTGEADGNSDSDDSDLEWSNIAKSHFDDKSCMHDDDCDDDKVCFGALFGGLCGEPYGEGESCTRDEMCRGAALCIMGRCQTGAVPGQEGAVCEVADDCQAGLCCGYLNEGEFCDVVTTVCKPSLHEGEPCTHGSLFSLLMPMMPMSLFGGQGGDCSCNTGLRCGKDESGSRVCIVDGVEVSDAMDPAEMPKPPVEDAGIVVEDAGTVEDDGTDFEQVPEREVRGAEEYTMEEDDGALVQFNEWVKEVLGMTDTADEDVECSETDDNPNTPEDTEEIPNTPEAVAKAEPEDDGFQEFLSEIKELIDEEVFPSSDDSDESDELIDEDFPDDTLKFEPYRDD
ncbi:DKK3 [Branchiostoma lanceolatum]|uniref:DKK3 protein n=1 Tax=Branchiostoma lanceolatum TaxID=7740 RepID=A0A8J9ZAY4_BRALA|nr:DKK3 [Branchiostoma lanceolatum]